MPPVVSIVGKSNSGKTTFIGKLVRELKSRGYRVAVIKHTKHDFEIDHVGKDTYRHTEAGADTVVIVAPHKLALMKKLDREIEASEILALVGEDYDIIITEGYKQGPFPKIEVSRTAHSEELISEPDELIALVTDNEFTNGLQHFGLDDTAAVADFIEERFALNGERVGE